MPSIQIRTWCISLLVVLATAVRSEAQVVTSDFQDYIDAVRASMPPPRPAFDPQRWGWRPIGIWPSTPAIVSAEVHARFGDVHADGRYWFPVQTPVTRLEREPVSPFRMEPKRFDTDFFPADLTRCYGCLGGTGDAQRLWINNGVPIHAWDFTTLGGFAQGADVYFDPASFLDTVNPRDPAFPGGRFTNEVCPYPSIVAIGHEPGCAERVISRGTPKPKPAPEVPHRLRGIKSLFVPGVADIVLGNKQAGDWADKHIGPYIPTPIAAVLSVIDKVTYPVMGAFDTDFENGVYTPYSRWLGHVWKAHADQHRENHRPLAPCEKKNDGLDGMRDANIRLYGRESRPGSWVR